jgi:replication-associated recombination protein RarA
MSWSFDQATTIHGYPLDEVVSALQKTIRRGLVDEAMWYAVEMNRSGYGAYCWRRLMVICAEDVGIADMNAPVVVASLWTMAKELQSRTGSGTQAEKHSREWDGECLLEAVYYLAKAEKNRTIADADSLIYIRQDRGERLEIPDAALDLHTGRGRKMGRDEGHFQREGRVVIPHKVIDGDRWSAAFQAERPAADDEAPDSEERPGSAGAGGMP